MKKVLLAAVIAAWTGHVFAKTGNELLDEIRSSDRVRSGLGHITGEDVTKAGVWLGFIQGVSWTLDDIDPRVCLPRSGTTGQSAAVVKQYLEQNPAQLHRPAHVLVREALQRAFPCR